MGVWGPGLYSSDFASDLRATIGAVAKLPFDGERLVEILQQTENEVSNCDTDEDYTTFWLVTADQFHKRGIRDDNLYRRVREIIDSGHDAKMAADLGMSKTDLRKRERNLLALREKIAAPPAAKQRRTLTKPQPFILEVGHLFVFPLSESGQTKNPYLSKDQLARSAWVQAKWGAGLVVGVGRAFDYLAWYQAIKLSQALKETWKFCESDLTDSSWQMAAPGTLSRSHFKKMEIKILAKLDLSKEAVNDQLTLVDGTNYAIHDISICNSLSIGEKGQAVDLKSLNALIAN